MKAPRAPRLDEKRSAEFSAELQERARAWIPSWGLTDAEHDFGRALLEIAARFNSEVAERFDDVGEKMRRGFLDWLGVRGEAARPARMPVVFKLADTAREGVLASAPVRMQADADGTPVVFETEKEVRVIPGRLEVVVGIDAEEDAFYLPAPGLNDLKPLEPLPTKWQLKGFASAGGSTLQLDPESGLLPEMLIEAGGQQYRVVKADKDLVTIEPPLAGGLAPGTTVTKVTIFAPFDGQSRNQQEHALYLGDSELLNIDDAARIEVVGAATLQTGVTWQYWGKVANGDVDAKPDWHELTLAQEQDEFDAVILTKPKGSIELREIAGKNSRWIRCKTPALVSSVEQFSVDALKLRINCLDEEPKCGESAPTSDDSSEGDTKSSGPAAEAMANTTPLVLSEPFFPLGREPRLFDAFYLGSTEAFSKKGATAQLCFEMSDATCVAYTKVGAGTSAEKILAGVGKDRALHLFKFDNGHITKFRGPLRPPRPPEPGAQVDQVTPLELNLRCRPVIWNGEAANPDDYFVAVAAGGAIWVWHENSDQKKSGWSLHSTVGDSSNTPAHIEDIIVLSSASRRPGAVLSSGRFYVFNEPTKEWLEPIPNSPVRRSALAPIFDNNGNLTDSMVSVSATGELRRLEKNGTESAAAGVVVDFVAPGTDLPMGIRPAAIDDGRLRVVAVSQGRRELVAVEFSGGAWRAPQRVALPTEPTDTEAIGAQVTFAIVAGSVDGIMQPARQFFVGAKTAAGGAFVASWVPTFVSNDPTSLFQSTIPDASGPIGGTPIEVGNFLVVPGGKGDTFVAPINPFARLEFTLKRIREGVILPAATFAVHDFGSVMTKDVATPRQEWKIGRVPSVRGSEFIYMVDPPVGELVAVDPQLIGYLADGSRSGTINSEFDFDVTPPDPDLAVGMILRIKITGQPTTFCEVKTADFDPDAEFGNVSLKTATPLPVNTGDLNYWKPNPSVARVLPAVRFQPFGDGNWDASILDRAGVYFPTPPAAPQPAPSPQRATAWGVTGISPTVVALSQRWTSAPPPLNAVTPFIIDAVIGAWRHERSDTTSNPALSWEYWNGKGWWSLEIIDRTEHLATTGTVKFTVPQDLAESDWSGKTNFWIRVRLVGGDYGQEEVTVISTPIPNNGGTEQVVKRSTANIRAPLVLDLRVSYWICSEVLPQFVLAKDSGTLRDQSDANRTEGAIVEAFVPLALTLGRLTKTGASTETKSPADCPPDCDCTTLHAGKAEPADAASTVAVPATRVSGRELYIGLAATPSEGPVNVLLLVDERPHTEFAPLQVEALSADRFKPIVAGDATRALGESGVLSMSFSVPPTRAELFGKGNLTWLRLKRGPKATDKWLPSIRGAYLNAAWASATETLTRELLGSSNGAPNLVVRLARPPVLRDTLELRVKEPLGEEERKALLKIDPNSVLSVVEGLPGDWVLWRKVIDPDDEPATERVYALDETNGEIRFGDGQHGKIPPIGRDSIVAFSYARTEPDPTGGDSVPANKIAARTALNLVSPVESVESVVAADQAAGGAPTESDERVLRFGFARQRHRSRAVTAYDLEDLALQSSPDIVQARAFVRRGYVRLVVVMGGKNPLPNAAQIRELRRLLLDAAPAALSAPKALRIEQPGIRRLRISLNLVVESIDHTGELSAFVKEKLARFFDTATGGVDKDGWALGLNPSGDDIAFALADAPYLESIEQVTLLDITDDGNEHLWEEQPTRATEIVMLDDDPVRFHFETAEVMA